MLQSQYLQQKESPQFNIKSSDKFQNLGQTSIFANTWNNFCRPCTNFIFFFGLTTLTKDGKGKNIYLAEWDKVWSRLSAHLQSFHSGSLWLFLVVSSSLWFPPALTGSLWLSLALTGSLPVSLWLSTALCDSLSGFLWLLLTLSGFHLLSLAPTGSLPVSLWLSLALTATLWHTLALSGSLLLSNFAYTVLHRLSGPLLGSQRCCHVVLGA